MLEPDFRDMLSAFNEARVEYLVVGAFALAGHGLPRATGDLDFWVRATPENAVRVMQAVASFGAPAGIATAQDFATPDIVVQIGIEPLRIDILTSISGVDFNEAYAARLSAVVDGVSLPILGVEHLIQNKRASGRKKDLLDVEWLETTYRVQGGRGEAP
jgi:hypothetical protein